MGVLRHLCFLHGLDALWLLLMASSGSPGKDSQGYRGRKRQEGAEKVRAGLSNDLELVGPCRAGDDLFPWSPDVLGALWKKGVLPSFCEGGGRG